MADYIRELDSILSSTGRKLLQQSGSIPHIQASKKAKLEYKNKILTSVGEEYLKTINTLERQALHESRNKLKI
jgi:hypothetical protein